MYICAHTENFVMKVQRKEFKTKIIKNIKKIT